jgi:hypothetical protein
MYKIHTRKTVQLKRQMRMKQDKQTKSRLWGPNNVKWKTKERCGNSDMRQRTWKTANVRPKAHRNRKKEWVSAEGLRKANRRTDKEKHRNMKKVNRKTEKNIEIWPTGDHRMKCHHQAHHGYTKERTKYTKKRSKRVAKRSSKQEGNFFFS